MKLTRLSEAVNTRRQLSDSAHFLSETDQVDKAHLLFQALDELGIKNKWRVPKNRVTDDIVDRTILLMNNRKKNGHTGDMMWPLLKMSDGLEILKGVSCQKGLSSLISGLGQVKTDGFLAGDQISELLNAANLLVAQSTELFVYTELLTNTMAAVLLVLKKTTSEDAYEKAIAMATLKKLGLKD